MEKTIPPSTSGMFAPIRTLDEVIDAWHAISGERLTRQRVCQIHKEALDKIRRFLEDEDNAKLRRELLDHI